MRFDGDTSVWLSGHQEPLHIIEKLHFQSVHFIKVNRIEFLKKDLFWWLDICEINSSTIQFLTLPSTDKSGMLEYRSSQMNEYKFPKNVNFTTNMETDLYEFSKVIDCL
jgi:hypothetical protein